jgi:peflin
LTPKTIKFAGLWNYVKQWQQVFRYFDRDNSGSIGPDEIQEAFQQFNFQLSPALVELVQRKYAPVRESKIGLPPIGFPSEAPPPPQPRPGISFDHFVRTCVAAKQLSEAFKKLDSDNDGWVRMDHDQFMHTLLTLP